VVCQSGGEDAGEEGEVAFVDVGEGCGLVGVDDQEAVVGAVGVDGDGDEGAVAAAGALVEAGWWVLVEVVDGEGVFSVGDAQVELPRFRRQVGACGYAAA
jgi:hypothetical protein